MEAQMLAEIPAQSINAWHDLQFPHVYPEKLKNHISEEDFFANIDRINAAVQVAPLIRYLRATGLVAVFLGALAFLVALFVKAGWDWLFDFAAVGGVGLLALSTSFLLKKFALLIGLEEVMPLINDQFSPLELIWTVITADMWKRAPNVLLTVELEAEPIEM